MKKLCVYAILLMGLLGGAVWAQIPANMMQADGSADGKPYLREHLALPTEIHQMLDENKAKEAVAEYEKLKKTLQVNDPLDMYFWDLEVYGTASFIDPSNPAYGKMREDILERMVKEYPDNAEVLMYALPADGNLDKSLEVLNKVIEVDPEYLPAYEQRFYIYKEKKMIKEACQDYVKLPEMTQSGLLDPGMDCSKEMEAVQK